VGGAEAGLSKGLGMISLFMGELAPLTGALAGASGGASMSASVLGGGLQRLADSGVVGDAVEGGIRPARPIGSGIAGAAEQVGDFFSPKPPPSPKMAPGT